MKQYYINRVKYFMPILYANVFSTICQLWGVSTFWQAKHMNQLNKQELKLSGVYIFMNYERIPQYIGMADNLAERLKLSHKDYRNDSIIIIPCPGKVGNVGKNTILETALIGAFQPERNKKSLIK